MPEGHSVHRIARQFDRNIVGRDRRRQQPAGPVRRGRVHHRRAHRHGGARRRQADVPRVRRRPLAARAPRDVRRVGLRRRDPRRPHDRVGERTDGPDEPARARCCPTAPPRQPILDGAGENSLTSIGAPRRARVHVRMSEQTTGLADEGDEWPPPVVGQVRLRLLTDVDVRRPAGPDRVRAADAGRGRRDDREARSRPARRRRRRGRGALHRRRASQADRRSGCC